MAVNDISPGFVKLYYNSGGRNHVQTLPVKPVSPIAGGSNDVYDAVGNPVSFFGAIATYAALLQNMLTSSDDIIRAELWSKPTPSDNPIFLQARDLSLAGAGTSAGEDFVQTSLTMRSASGGLLRHSLQDTKYNNNIVSSAPFSQGEITALVDYYLSDDAIVFARDGGRAITSIRFITKVNDAIRKKALDL
jgi:hypothetical protein